MKKKIELPILQPDFICYNHLTYADAIIRANAKEKDKILMTSKYINCYYKEESVQHKFVISIFDHWCTTQKVMQNQNLNLLKTTYQSLQINMISVIKKFLCNSSYVFGQCNYSYIEPLKKPELPLFNYVITGFDDIRRQFTVYGLDINNNFICKQIDYAIFIDSLLDTSKPNISFSLWKFNQETNIEFDIPNIIFELEDYINSENRRNHYKEDKVYGISAIECLREYLSQKIDSVEEINEFYLKKLLCHKKYMRDRIECLNNYKFINGRWLYDADRVYAIALNIYEQGKALNTNKDTVLGAHLVNLFSEMIDIEKPYLFSVLNELKLNNTN